MPVDGIITFPASGLTSFSINRIKGRRKYMGTIPFSTTLNESTVTDLSLDGRIIVKWIKAKSKISGLMSSSTV